MMLFCRVHIFGSRVNIVELAGFWEELDMTKTKSVQVKGFGALSSWVCDKVTPSCFYWIGFSFPLLLWVWDFLFTSDVLACIVVEHFVFDAHACFLMALCLDRLYAMYFVALGYLLEELLMNKNVWAGDVCSFEWDGHHIMKKADVNQHVLWLCRSDMECVLGLSKTDSTAFGGARRGGSVGKELEPFKWRTWTKYWKDGDQSIRILPQPLNGGCRGPSGDP